MLMTYDDFAQPETLRRAAGWPITFETAVLYVLREHGFHQRLDGLLCEPLMMAIPTPWFWRWRLRWLKRLGLIEIERCFYPHHLPYLRAVPGKGKHWRTRTRSWSVPTG